MALFRAVHKELRRLAPAATWVEFARAAAHELGYTRMLLDTVPSMAAA